MLPEETKKSVKEKYGKIACDITSEKSCCSSSFCCGDKETYTIFSESYENREGYIPEADFGLGCGIPTDYAGIKKGDHVLDLGSGAGNDCFVARALVGDNGRVTGLDMTEQMVKKARGNCEKLKFENIEFVIGDIENMPFEDNLFDVVISNCVLNLVPDKHKAFSEIFRVLKPGGRFCVSDVVIRGALPEKMKKDAELYTGCISGASEMTEYIRIVEKTGFLNLKIHKQKEIQLPASILSEYNSVEGLNSYKASETGIFSITISALKPE